MQQQIGLTAATFFGALAAPELHDWLTPLGYSWGQVVGGGDPHDSAPPPPAEVAAVRDFLAQHVYVPPPWRASTDHSWNILATEPGAETSRLVATCAFYGRTVEDPLGRFLVDGNARRIAACVSGCKGLLHPELLAHFVAVVQLAASLAGRHWLAAQLLLAQALTQLGAPLIEDDRLLPACDRLLPHADGSLDLRQDPLADPPGETG